MNGRVMVLAGGSRGIGEAVAVLAAQRGYEVVLSYASDAARAAAVVDRIEAAGGRALAVHADTAEESHIEHLFEAADRRGRLAAMVYNSGITGAKSPLADADTATVAAVLDVNLRGAILSCRAAIRRMSTRYGGEGGSIVMVSSRASFYGSPSEFVW